ncbi:MAG: hypothetical protein ABI891_01575 [Acidobacteriota bacterium]
MNFFKKIFSKIRRENIWARPEMAITFRAELMPGKNREERTFKVKKVLANGRVILYNFIGEHRQSEFESVNFNRNL